MIETTMETVTAEAVEAVKPYTFRPQLLFS